MSRSSGIRPLHDGAGLGNRARPTRASQFWGTPARPGGFRPRGAALRRGGALIQMLIATWLVGILVAPNLPGGQGNLALMSVALLWLVPVGMALGVWRLSAPPLFRQQPWLFGLVLFFLLTALLSATGAPDSDLAVGYVGITALGVFICAGLWGFWKGHEIATLRLYSCLGAVSILLLVWLSPQRFNAPGRLDAFRNPNSIGLIAASVFFSAFALRSLALRTAVLGLSGAVILGTDSRSAIIGTVIGLFVYLVTTWSQFSKRQRTAVIVLVALSGVGAAAYSSRVMRSIDKVLALNDPYRGVGTGFTGRLSAWEFAIGLWRSHPLLGVGYRNQGIYFSKGTKYSSSHNGYLSLLVETGVLGFSSVLVIFLSGAIRLWKSRKTNPRVARLALSLRGCYLFIAVFERYTINFGNPMSILVLIFLLAPSIRGLMPQRRGHPPSPARDVGSIGKHQM